MSFPDVRALRLSLTVIVATCCLTACASKYPEMQTVDKVDIERFMGDWYVIANIPTFLEKGAHNAVETYRLDDDGTIATTFNFRKDGFDGKRKQYNPRGFIVDTDTNALWGMRFVWPVKADYRIALMTITRRQSSAAKSATSFGSWRALRRFLKKTTSASSISLSLSVTTNRRFGAYRKAGSTEELG